eukprot:3120471-Rhodomonas_salina.1
MKATRATSNKRMNSRGVAKADRITTTVESLKRTFRPKRTTTTSGVLVRARGHCGHGATHVAVVGLEGTLVLDAPLSIILGGEVTVQDCVVAVHWLDRLALPEGRLREGPPRKEALGGQRGGIACLQHLGRPQSSSPDLHIVNIPVAVFANAVVVENNCAHVGQGGGPRGGLAVDV